MNSLRSIMNCGISTAKQLDVFADMCTIYGWDHLEVDARFTALAIRLVVQEQAESLDNINAADTRLDAA